MKNLADLISAIATLLWPLFAFAVVYIYKGEIRDLMRRIKRGKLLGQELELDKSLDELAEEANAVAASVPELSTVTSKKELTENESLDQNVEAPHVSHLLPEKTHSVQSPEQGIIRRHLSCEIGSCLEYYRQTFLLV